MDFGGVSPPVLTEGTAPCCHHASQAPLKPGPQTLRPISQPLGALSPRQPDLGCKRPRLRCHYHGE